MLGRPFRPDAMFAWPTGRSAIMGPEQAASVLAQVRAQINEREGKSWTPEEEEKLKMIIGDGDPKGKWQEIAEQMGTERSAMSVEQHW
mgnify:CR=1 FL=1